MQQGVLRMYRTLCCTIATLLLVVTFASQSAHAAAGTSTRMDVRDSIDESTTPYGLAPSGLYAEFSLDLIIQALTQAAAKIDEVVNLASLPDYDGSNSEVTYELSDAWANIDVFNPEFGAYGPDVLVAFNVTFQAYVNYHMVAKDWPHPAEDGYLQFWTTEPIELLVSTDVDLTGATASITVDSAYLLFDYGAIQSYIHCTNAICLLPVGDILNGIDGILIGSIQTGIVSGLNGALATSVNTIPLTLSVPLPLGSASSVEVDFSGPQTVLDYNWVIEPLLEFATSQSSGGPPFKPDFIPPLADFNAPSRGLQFYWTDYLINGAVWVLYDEGLLTQDITSALIPASSPVQLNTDNLYMKLIATGLAAFGSKNITIQVEVDEAPTLGFVDAGVLRMSNQSAVLNFYVNNVTAPTDPENLVFAFSLGAQLGFDLSLTLGSPYTNDLNVTMDFANVTASFEEISSAIGDVDTGALNLVVPIILKLLKPISIPFAVPGGSTDGIQVTISNPTTTVADGYAIFGADVALWVPSDRTFCNSYEYCPAGDTCCPTTDGGFACCPFAGASCCSDGGCCPSGSTCTNDYCYADKKKKVFRSELLETDLMPKLEAPVNVDKSSPRFHAFKPPLRDEVLSGSPFDSFVEQQFGDHRVVKVQD